MSSRGPTGPPAGDPRHNAGVDQVVVGAAVVRGGAVLAARRTAPPEVAGRWELPGGKVEPGESPQDALVREVAEELGCTVVVTEWLGPDVPIRAGLSLRVGVARLVDGDPSPREHDRVRWLGPEQLDEVDWLEADRPFLDALRRLLAHPAARGILEDREAAEAVAATLRREGFDAWTERESFAGEDDDEDHAWAVLSDAPGVRLELLVEERDGWYDPGPAESATPQVALPRAPRR